MATLERRQGFKIACPEEIAYRMDFFDLFDLEACADRHAKSSYGVYLQRLLEGGREVSDRQACGRVPSVRPAAVLGAGG